MTHAILSKSLGIPRIIARLRDPHYEQAYRGAGVTTIVNVAGLLINQVMKEIEQPKVKRIMTLGGEKTEVYMVKIPKRAKSVEKKYRNSQSGYLFEGMRFHGDIP